MQYWPHAGGGTGLCSNRQQEAATGHAEAPCTGESGGGGSLPEEDEAPGEGTPWRFERAGGKHAARKKVPSWSATTF